MNIDKLSFEEMGVVENYISLCRILVSLEIFSKKQRKDFYSLLRKDTGKFGQPGELAEDFITLFERFREGD